MPADNATEINNIEQVVVFKLAGEEYAAPILEVQEIITTGDITPFPNAPSYISGIINVRGTVATIVNLASKFNLTRADQTNANRYIILTNTDKALFGLMVDEVTSVMKLDKTSLKEANSVKEGTVAKDYIKNVAVVDDRVILIVDFISILDDANIIEVSNQAQQQ